MEKIFTIIVILLLMSVVAAAQTFENITYQTTPGNTNSALSTSYVVGATDGTFNVNLAGAATYTIPIKVPDGRGNFAPTLSLTYSSMGGAGVAGYGWNIQGISSISRAPQNLYYDNNVTNVKFNWDDRLSLDGQRLVTTGSYGQHEVEHRLANDNFTKVFPQWTSGNGPLKFEAYFKDGSRLRYGYEEYNGSPKIEGRNEIAAWYVIEATDRKGNYINYEYINDGCFAYPSYIVYSPSIRIYFNYKARADTVINYVGGYKFEQRLLLDNIEVTCNNNTVRKYQLNYYKLNPDQSFNNSLLKEIVEYGTNGQRINSTIFDYGSPSNVAIGNETAIYPNAYISTAYDLYPGDFNGDGIIDIFAVDKSTKQSWRIFQGSGGSLNLLSSGSVSYTINKAVVGDLNGDGKDDLMIVNERISGATSIVSYYYSISTGISLGAFTSITTINSTNVGQSNNYYLGDYDGDGVLDLLIKKWTGSTNTICNWYLYSMGSSSGIGSMTQKNTGTIADWGDIDFVGDFNGDGKSDIWVVNNDGIKIYTINGSSLTQLYSGAYPNNDHVFEPGDFNGDGKMDIFVHDMIPKVGVFWQMLLSSGTDFIRFTIPTCKSNLKNDKVFTADVNGDGRTDIVAFSKTGTTCYAYFFVAKANGNGFFTIQKQDSQLDMNYSFVVRDINGDGKADILSSSSSSGYRIKFTTGNPEILLRKIRDGSGNKTSIGYSHLNDAACYQKGSTTVGFPMGIFAGPLKVVKTIRTSGTGLIADSIIYQYEGLAYHKRGKGVLGYLKTNVRNYSKSINVETNQSFNTTYFYPATLSTTKKTTSGSQMETTSTSFSCIVLNSTKKQIFLYPSTTTFTNKLSNQVKKTDMLYNSAGNLRRVVNTYLNNTTRIASDSTLYGYGSENTAQWLIGRPTQDTAYYRRQGESDIIIRTDRTYSATSNLITSETRFANKTNDEKLIRRFEYNSYGQLICDSLTNYSGSQKRVTRFTYSGARLSTAKGPSGLPTTYAYNSYGYLLSETDYLGNTTSYTYDALGKILTKSLPDGYIASTAYVWTGDNKPAGAVYGIQKSGNDNSKSTEWYNSAGMLLRKVEKSLNGTMVLTDTEYDTKNRLWKTKYPYFSGGTIINAETYGYDSYGRLTSATRTSGKNTTVAYDNNGKVTTTTGGKATWKITDAQGLTTQAGDNGGTISYTYYANGNLKKITAPNNIITTMEYNIAGNRTKLIDPSAGTITSTYDVFGQLISEINARNTTTNYTYDSSDGRVLTKTVGLETTNYAYHSTKKYIIEITSPGNVSRSYSYDSKGRVTSTIENITGSAFTTSVTYDNIGRLSTRAHPSGIVETLNYSTTSGHLESISTNNVLRYKINSVNARGQVTNATQATIIREFGYDDYGYPTYTKTQRNNSYMQDYRYVFNPVTGNLTSRQNALGTDLIETFTYDNLDRLTKVQKGTTTLTTTLQMGYATNGNITSKSDIGTVFEYTKAGSPYALTAVESSAGEIPLATQTATYTSFEKVNTISEAGYTATFTYNSDGQRAQMIERQGSTTTLTRWYPTASYMKEKKGSVTSEYTWIGGDAYTAPVLIMKTGAVTYLYFLLRDHLGNITHVMNEYMVIYEYSYDAWGRRRNKTNWSYTLDNNDRELLGDRGFAGHEYLGNFKLYNMNGRMYDPLVGRFLSPDPYVQAPDFTQNLNRYSYALNNPLKYEDPDGEWLEQIAWPFFFFVDLLSNVINGVDHPGKNAAKNATTMLNGMSNAAQINIYSDENTKITVGINPFTFDLSANIYSRAGDKGIFHQGFGIGANSGPYMDFDASIYFDKFNLSMGFGGGNNYSGWNASITWPKGWGIGYGTTNYGNAIGPDGKSNAQIVGSFTAFFPKGSFNLQNDFLAFSGQDRWRTSAWELNIGDWSLGSSVYTNDPLNDYGQDDFIAPGYSPTWGPNTDGFGEWYNGQVYSSPLWIGHRSGNTISRIGYSHWRVQDATQNGIHRYFPLGRQNYYTGYDYFQGGMKGKWYGYSGYYNPFSLYQ